MPLFLFIPRINAYALEAMTTPDSDLHVISTESLSNTKSTMAAQNSTSTNFQGTPVDISKIPVFIIVLIIIVVVMLVLFLYQNLSLCTSFTDRFNSRLKIKKPRPVTELYVEKSLDKLFESNAKWASKLKNRDSQYFQKQSKAQSPPLLWIGCSDSRVPPTTIANLNPGDVFVQRNVGNLVLDDDSNVNAAIEYSVLVLKVKHIVLCGHYCCGAVKASMGNDTGLAGLEKWISSIRQTYKEYGHKISMLPEDMQHDIMCELNAIVNAARICNSKAVQKAWSDGQSLTVHAMCYSISTGKLVNLGVEFKSLQEVQRSYERILNERLRWIPQ